MFFSEDYWGQYSKFGPPYLRMMIRMGDVELSDYSHQECLHLDDPIQEAVLSVSGRENNTNMTNARESPPNATPNAS